MKFRSIQIFCHFFFQHRFYSIYKLLLKQEPVGRRRRFNPFMKIDFTMIFKQMLKCLYNMRYVISEFDLMNLSPHVASQMQGKNKSPFRVH